MKHLSRFAFVIVLPLISVACSQALSFKGGSSSGALQNPGCRPGETTVTKPTKFLFVVDQSGSNVDGPFEHPGQATDPQKNFRHGVISEFVQKHGGKSYINWNFISFSGASAQPLINGFGDLSMMNTALATFLASDDSGNTPYKAALQLARDTIAQDAARGGPVTYQYRVAFLTDGYPTDYCSNPNATSCPGAVREFEIDRDVMAVAGAAPGAVQFSTVYYGLPDATASSRLQRMAAKGGGQFVDTNVTRTINLDDVMKIPTTCN